jgi:peptide/nickel transport system ATP-binding protein/oligopeptide transport system ATP-binding protein
MYTGRIVETAPAGALFRAPRHPYTQGLLGSVLRLGAGRDAPLGGIPGSVPDLLDLPLGCTFHPRCPIADRSCEAAFPPLRPMAERRACACYKVHAN